jgi:8-amino-7-oxononanoate synthase
MSLADRWQTELAQLRAQGRYRALTHPAGIDFSSNDYLGYSKRAWSASHHSRSGAASRLLRGHHPIWDEVETRLASWHGAEAALVFASGYAANEGLLSTIIAPGDVVFSDQLNHASIIDGLRLTRAEKVLFPHNDVNELESLMRRQSAKRVARQAWFLVTESLFGMDGDEAPLPELADLADRHDAYLIVDEAHATGCFGSIGSGIVDMLNLRRCTLATVHTGGKALAVPGAYIAGTALLKEVLVNRCRHLIFTTALPPQVGAWWLDALDLIQSDEATRAALRANCAEFRRACQEHGVVVGGRHHIATVMLGADASAVDGARRLQRAGFDVRAIRPPTVPPGTARLRIAIHADHDASHLRDLAAALASS